MRWSSLVRRAPLTLRVEPSRPFRIRPVCSVGTCRLAGRPILEVVQACLPLSLSKPADRAQLQCWPVPLACVRAAVSPAEAVLHGKGCEVEGDFTRRTFVKRKQAVGGWFGEAGCLRQGRSATPTLLGFKSALFDVRHLGSSLKSVVKPNSMAHNFMGIDIDGNWAHWFSSAQSAGISPI
jgi:hypothetical protein